MKKTFTTFIVAAAMVGLLAGPASANELFMLVKKGQVEEARKLIASQPHLVSEKSYGGFTPLHIAAITGNVEMATALLEGGAEVNAITNTYTKPLYFAILNKHQEMAELLQSRGAN